MNQADIAALMRGIAPVLRDTISRALQPIVHRIVALENREPKQGEKGERGDDGSDGQDGAPGDKGEQGEKGDKGQDGRDGADAYAGRALGLYNPEETGYRAMDVVSYGGSEWRAKQDDPGPLPGEGWMLSASKGKRGEKGERGERGNDGNDGAPGASFCVGYIDVNELHLVLTRDDGEEVTIDLQPFAEMLRAA